MPSVARVSPQASRAWAPLSDQVERLDVSVLSTLSVPPQEIGRSGFGYRILDEFDIPDLQFFSADVARENMESRVMERLADEVTRQVALTLRRRQAAAPA